MILGGHTIVIVRPAGTDPHGDPLPGSPIETLVTGCFVQPGGSTEETDRRDTVVTTATAYLPAPTDIKATDRVRWEGRLYQVDGEPARWTGPAGAPHHIEATLRRVDG